MANEAFYLTLVENRRTYEALFLTRFRKNKRVRKNQTGQKILVDTTELKMGLNLSWYE